MMMPSLPKNGKLFVSLIISCSLVLLQNAYGQAPEIEIVGNNVVIVDGNSTPNAANHTDFGSATVVMGTVVRTFTINNTGTTDLVLGVSTIGGTHSGDFMVTSMPSSPVSGGGSTTVEVTFDPSSSGQRDANISIVTNDTDENPYNFDITGTGVEPEMDVSEAGVGAIADEGGPVNFGSVTTAGTSAAFTFTITNNGTSDLSLTAPPALSGTHITEFTLMDLTSTPIIPNGSTTFTIAFTPVSAGTKTATVSIANDDPDENPYNFDITGTGVEPEMDVSEAGVGAIANGDDFDFGIVPERGGSRAVTFTITNSGTSTLALTGGATLISIAGANAADFTIDEGMTSNEVLPNGMTTFTIDFAPSSGGSKTARISIANDDPDENPYNFDIIGTGVEPEIDVSEAGVGAIANGDDFDFGIVPERGGSRAVTFTITNSGTSTLALTGGTTLISIAGANAADFTIDEGMTSHEVLPNGMTTFTIDFAPSSGGSKTARISIANDDRDENPYVINLTGSGLGQVSALTPGCALGGINLTWTRPVGSHATDWDGVIIYAREGSPVSDQRLVAQNPDDFFADNTSNTIVFNDNGTEGAAADDSEFVIYKSTANTDGAIDISGLTAGVEYFFAVYSFKDNGANSGGIWTPSVTTSGFSSMVTDLNAFTGNGEITVAWTNSPNNSCVTNVIVIGRENPPNASVTSGVNATNLFDSRVVPSSIVYDNTWPYDQASDAINFIPSLNRTDRNHFNLNIAGPGTSGKMTGFTNGTEYNFRVFLYEVDRMENVPGSVDVLQGVVEVAPDGDLIAVPLELPANPTSFAGDCSTSAGVNLSWTKPTGTFNTLWDGIYLVAKAGMDPAPTVMPDAATLTDGSGSVTDSKGVFYRGSTLDDGSIVVGIQTTDTDGNFEISDLATGVNYHFKAWAFRDPGGASDDVFSHGTSVVIGTSAGITGLAATPGPEEITLHWNNPADASTSGRCTTTVMIVANEGGRLSDMPPGLPGLVDPDINQNTLNLLTATYVAESNWHSRNNTNDVINITGITTPFPLVSANQNYVVFNSLAETATITGLENDVDYQFKVFLIGDGSNPAFSQGQTINAAPTTVDTTPPILLLGTAQNVQAASFRIDVRLDEPGTYHYVVMENSVGTPPTTYLQVASGQNGNGTTADVVQSGFVVVDLAGIIFSDNVSFLTPSTNYDVYLVAEDDEAPTTNQQGLLTTFAVSTTHVPVSGVSIDNATTVAGTLIICSPGGFVALEDIVVTENNNNDFATGSNQTFGLSLPPGIEFNTMTGSVSRTSGTDLAAAMSMTVGATNLLITYTVNATRGIDEFTISGLEVQAVGTGSGNIIRIASGEGGNGIIAGDAPGDGVSHGTLNGVLAPSAPVITLMNTSFDYITDPAGSSPFTLSVPAAPAGAAIKYYMDAMGVTDIGALDNMQNPSFADLYGVTYTPDGMGSGSFATNGDDIGDHIRYVRYEDNMTGCKSPLVQIASQITPAFVLVPQLANYNTSFGEVILDITPKPQPLQTATPGRGFFSGSGITFDLTNDTWVFNTSDTGVGNHKVTYSFTGSNGTKDVSQTIEVGIPEPFIVQADPLPSVVPLTPPRSGGICLHDGAVRGKETNTTINVSFDPGKLNQLPPGWSLADSNAFQYNSGGGTPLKFVSDNDTPGNTNDDVYQFNADDALVNNGDQYGELTLSIIVQNDADPSITQLFANQQTEIIPVPVMDLSIPNANASISRFTFCMDDGAATFEGSLRNSTGGDPVEITIDSSTEFTVTNVQPSATHGGMSKVFMGANFTPMDLLNDAMIGIDRSRGESVANFILAVTSSPDSDPARPLFDNSLGCPATGEAFFFIFDKPSEPSLMGGIHDFEFCEGDKIPDLNVETERDVVYDWFEDINPKNGMMEGPGDQIFTQTAGGGTIGAVELFDTPSPQAGSYFFHFRKRILSNVGAGDDGSGCTGDFTRVDIFVRAVPVAPDMALFDDEDDPITSTNRAKRQGGADDGIDAEYIFHFCEGDALTSIDMASTLLTGSPPPNSRFIWYSDAALTTQVSDQFSDATVEIEGTDLMITAGQLVGSGLANTDGRYMHSGGVYSGRYPDTVTEAEFELYVVQSNFEVTAGFAGCQGPITKITLKFYQTPDPIAPNPLLFDNGTGFVVTDGTLGRQVVKRYICAPMSGLAVISPILAPSVPEESNISTYNWYPGTVAVPDFGNQTTVNSFQDQTISQAELVTGGLNLAVPGTYYFWVTQSYNQKRSELFNGCESQLVTSATRVDIIVFASPPAPDAMSSTGSFNFCDFEIEGLGVDFSIDNQDAPSTINWFDADHSFAVTNPVPHSTTDPDIGASDELLLGGITGPASRYFVVDQVNNQDPAINENPSGIDFTGCTSTHTDIAVVVNPLPEVELLDDAGGALLNSYCVDLGNVILEEANNLDGTFSGAPAGLTPDPVMDGKVNFNFFQFLGVTDETQFQDENAPEPVTITFSYTDVNGCTNTDSHTLNINPEPSIFLEAPENPFVANQTEICLSEVSLGLQGRDPSGGGIGLYQFNGMASDPGLVPLVQGRANFIPDLATNKNLTDQSFSVITYTFTNGNNCSNSIDKTIIVNPDPTITTEEIGGCDEEPVVFTADVQLPATDGVATVDWNFDIDEELSASDLIISDGTTLNPTVSYQVFGEYSYNVSIVSNKGCSGISVDRGVFIGDIPQSSIDWEGICLDQEILFKGAPTDVNLGIIEEISFIFGDGTMERFVSTGGGLDGFGDNLIKNPDTGEKFFSVTHKYTTPGIFDLQFEIITNNGCNDIEAKELYVLPTITPTPTSPYFEDFEENEDNQRNGLYVNGWVPDLKIRGEDNLLASANTWAFGTPQGKVISGANSGSNAWSTNLATTGGTYLPDEDSWVFTPCFDISQLQRPTVTFYRSFDFSNERDGVVFQYSLDNGDTWNVLGSHVGGNDESTGIEWYNTAGVLATPGGPSNDALVGWSGSDTDPGRWIQSRHKLDEIPIAERDAVLFRLALASDPANESEGFAIDDFFIGERPQTVLIEQFSGNASTVNGQQAIDEVLNNLTIDGQPGSQQLNNSDAVLITYKTGLAGENDINLTNPSDPNARVVFYGVESAPTFLIDGAQGRDVLLTTSFSTNEFNQNSLGAPDVLMNINLPPTVDDQIAVDVNMTLLDPTVFNGNNEDFNIRLYIAVVEKTVEDDSEMFRNVLRKMLPDGAGVPLVVNGSAIESISQSWNIQRVDDSDNLAVVAFIQNTETKRVIQAATIDVGDKADNIVADIGEEIINSEQVNIYPNPANEQTSVDFGTELEDDFEWVLYNQAGMLTHNGLVGRGIKKFVIETARFPSGMYYLRVGNENSRFKHFKLVVSH